MKESTKTKMTSMVNALNRSTLKDDLKQSYIAVVADAAEAANGHTYEEKVELTADNVFNLALSMGAVCITMQEGNDKIDKLVEDVARLGDKIDEICKTCAVKTISRPKTSKELLVESRWAIAVLGIGLAAAVAVAPGLGAILVQLASML